MSKHDTLYAYPPGGLNLVLDLLGELPAALQTSGVWDIYRVWVVAVADEVTAVWLALAFASDRPTAFDGRPALEPNEVLIAVEDRDEAERMLREVCGTVGKWTERLRVTTGSDNVHFLFVAHYRAARREASAGR